MSDVELDDVRKFFAWIRDEEGLHVGHTQANDSELAVDRAVRWARENHAGRPFRVVLDSSEGRRLGSVLFDANHRVCGAEGRITKKGKVSDGG